MSQMLSPELASNFEDNNIAVKIRDFFFKQPNTIFKIAKCFFLLEIGNKRLVLLF